MGGLSRSMPTGGAEFSTIQAAIDDANDGDTVLVADGLYTGDGNRDISFLGKAVTVRSENGPENCIIDINGIEGEWHRGVNFVSYEGRDSVLDGLTIANGYGLYDYGGGVYCHGSSPTISNCIFIGNTTGEGGGIACRDRYPYSFECSPLITHCVITGNSASAHGGGVYAAQYCVLEVRNCVITNNRTDWCGGGAASEWWGLLTLAGCLITNNHSSYLGGGLGAVDYGSLTMSGCTVSDNVAAQSGGGIYMEGTRDDFLDVENSVVWGNTAPGAGEMCLFSWPKQGFYGRIDYTNLNTLYCKWPSGWGDFELGDGIIEADPCFADPDAGDYHLMSQGGRWDPTGESWRLDDTTSPCIDAGNPWTSIGAEPFPNGGRANIGAYGGTTQASKSYFGGPPCETIIAGDINGDCKVDFTDFQFVFMNWLREETP